MLNEFCKGLSEFCGQNLLEEKWLLAPAFSVGRQWLENLAAHGKNTINVHVKTLESLAEEVSAEEIMQLHKSYADSDHSLALMFNACISASKECQYLLRPDVNEDIAKVMLDAINEIRLAGLGIEDCKAEAFEVEKKCYDIKLIFKEYITMLEDGDLIDYVSLLKAALDRSAGAREEEPILIYPSDMRFRALEADLIESFTDSKCIEVDKFDLQDKPECMKSDRADLFRASGMRNEIEEVVRRCVNNDIQFDDVEIICSDSKAYVSVIHEVSRGSFSGVECLKSGVPMTYSGGLEVRFARPLKALLGWLQWIHDGHMQTGLQNMLSEQLIELKKVSNHQACRLLRKLPIHFGIERYSSCIKLKINELAENKGEEKQGNYKQLQSSLEEILKLSKVDIDQNSRLLEAAGKFIENFSRTGSDLDEIGKDRLLDEIRAKSQLIQQCGLDSNWSAYDWLCSLGTELSILNSGPQPGHIHVSGLINGGHSGRSSIFIVGLDSSRYPGKYVPDPVILDSERKKISVKIRTAKQLFEENTSAAYGLLARLRGDVTLSYSYLNEKEESPASSMFINAYRMICGDFTADYTKVENETAAVSSLINEPDKALSANEYLLYQLSDGDRVAGEDICQNIQAGLDAAEKRRSNDFTEYDGNVPQAGKDNNPYGEKVSVSASALENMGKCPLKYFFSRILRIKLPEEFDYNKWLEANEAGTLLHTVFERFMKKLKEKNSLPPKAERDKGELGGILDEVVSETKKKRPPANEAVYRHQLDELKEACQIFLNEEELYGKDSSIGPEYFELNIDRSEGDGGPVEITLGDKVIKGTGRIDRIDKKQKEQGSTHQVWDYKTGGTFSFDGSETDPFLKGNLLQHYFYKRLAEGFFARKGNAINVSQVGFFFTGKKGRGKRIVFSAKELEGGKDVLAKICDAIGKGAFCGFMQEDNFEKGECGYCDYKQICQASGTVKDSFDKKYMNKENKALKPFAELKQYVQE